MQADAVIGVPDSGLDAALGYSQQSGIPYGIGLDVYKRQTPLFCPKRCRSTGAGRAMFTA